MGVLALAALDMKKLEDYQRATLEQIETHIQSIKAIDENTAGLWNTKEEALRGLEFQLKKVKASLGMVELSPEDLTKIKTEREKRGNRLKADAEERQKRCSSTF